MNNNPATHNRPHSATAEGLSAAIIETEDLNLYYGSEHALKSISIAIPKRRVTAVIGPSGSGKSSLLRCLNRMNDLVDHARVTGRVMLDGYDIYDRRVDVTRLRGKIGMVFQKPNPFPKTVYDNVAFGLRIAGITKRSQLNEKVEASLRKAALWDEVKDRMQTNALELSSGQQQRLVIARAIAIEPQVLLMDEPASALDPLSTLKIEELIKELKQHYTIVIVTHNMQQAARVSDLTAFFYLGELVEYDETTRIFTVPAKKRTEDYITGRYG